MLDYRPVRVRAEGISLSARKRVNHELEHVRTRMARIDAAKKGVDIETVFLYPWAVIYDELRIFGLIEMGTFFALLLAAYVYVWKRGGLEWAE